MKRYIAVLLVFATLLPMVLSGCAGGDNTTISVGQWLGMVNNAFGMESYAAETPYFSSVDANDEFFRTVQIAAEWDVIDIEEPIDPRANATWGDVLVTLVNVGNFLDTDVSRDEKIQYAIDHFDSSIRTYWLKREISVTKATALLMTAQEMWASREFEETFENVVYSNDTNVIDAAELVEGACQITEDTIVLPQEMADGMESGEVVVVPTDTGPVAYRVEEVATEDGVATITVSDDVELEEVVEELQIQTTVTMDMSQAEIYDGNGNLVYSGASSLAHNGENTGAYVSNLRGSKEDMTATDLVGKIKLEFESGGYEVSGSISGSTVSVSLSKKLDEETKAEVGLEVSNVKVTTDIDMGVTGLKSALAKADYTVKLSGGVSVEEKILDKTYAPQWSNGNGKFLSNLGRSTWKNASDKGAKTIKIADIKLASVGVASISVGILAKIKVDGSVELSVEQSGTKGIEYKKGNLRLINDVDWDWDFEAKAKIEATGSVVPKINAFGKAIIGVSAQGGIGASASLTVHLVDVENHKLQTAKLPEILPESCSNTNVTGMMTDAAEILALAQSLGGTYLTPPGTAVLLHLNHCVEVKAYFIFRVGLEEETLVGKALKGSKVKVTWEILGSKNAEILSVHVDNGDYVGTFIRFLSGQDVSQCTLEFEPFDAVEEETEPPTVAEEPEATEHEEIAVGEVLVVSTMKIIVKPNETDIVKISQIPAGYTASDLVFTSTDSAVAKISSDGVVSGVAEGSAMIVVSTSDGKYSCACSVTVNEDVEDSFTGLKDVVTQFVTNGGIA